MSGIVANKKKKKKVAMVARTATIGRGPLRLRLGVPESCWKSAEKERKSAGKERKSARKVSKVEEKRQFIS